MRIRLIALTLAGVLVTTSLAAAPIGITGETQRDVMLTIYNGARAKSGYCDGLSRRNFLKVGALGLGGLALPQLLQAEAASMQ